MKRALVSKRMGIPAGAHLSSEGIIGRLFFPTPLTQSRLNDRGAGARQSCRRWNSNSTINSDERRHPLANVVTPRGTVGPNPNIGSSSPSPLQVRRWSTLTAILLATLTGATTYIIGFSSGMNLIPDSSSKRYKFLSVEGFETGLKELGTWLPSDCYATDKDSLVSHGYSDWAALDSKALPGAVLYPRSTEDVVKIVKIAAKHSIPLIPYSGGTSLEGHTFAPPFTTADSKRKATVEKIATGGRLDVDKLQPGLAWTLDFSENMAEIVAIHGMFRFHLFFPPF
jgi:D-lactate dehydrogenase (cytochrome)